MNTEQQALKRLAEARSKLEHAMTQYGMHYHGCLVDTMEFRAAVDEAVKLGDKIESEEAMEEIKLGWYRATSEDGYSPDIEVVAVRGKKAGCFSSDGLFFPVHVDVIRKREYLGTELPPNGRWVDFDPAKVTCDMFPIKVRVSNNKVDWVESSLSGFDCKSSYPFISDMTTHKNCQIWEEE